MGSIVLNFDAAKDNIIDNGYPIMQSYRMKGCVYVPTGFIGKTLFSSSSPCMDVADILTLQHSGWEIGTHSNSHPNFIMVSKKRIEAEVVESIKYLKHIGINEISSISYPGDGISKKGIKIVEKYLKIGTMSNGISNNYNFNNFLNLTIKRNFICEKTFNEKRIKEYLTFLKGYKGFGVFSFHDIVSKPKYIDNDLSIDKFKKIIEMIDELNLPVKTFQDLQEEKVPFSERNFVPEMLMTIGSEGKRCYNSYIMGYVIYFIYKIEGIRKILTKWYYNKKISRINTDI